MSFLIEGDELLKKYNNIWNKVSNSVNKEFDSNPACNAKYQRSKMKSDEGKVNTVSYNY